MADVARYDFFEWDPEKEKINILKHGYDFLTASQVFLDPNKVVTQDELHSDTEPRWLCTGKVKDTIITVRFTFRGFFVRIIGAGNWRKGRRAYEKENP